MYLEICFLIVLGIISGFGLIYVLYSNKKTKNSAVPLFCLIAGVIMSSQLRDFGEAMGFLAAATAQFASFVFISRLRQRGSFSWHIVAALAANGTWYLTMHTLSAAKAYWPLFFLHIVGIVAGRIVGATWAQYIEQKFQLKSDASRDPRLAPGQRLRLISRERSIWVLVILLIAYLAYGTAEFETDLKQMLWIVFGLGLLQNFFYALSSRAAQRGNNWFMSTTGILNGIVFYSGATYLFSRNMPMLILPLYMLSTSLGSALGAFFSMIVEWKIKLAPDQHLTQDANKKASSWHNQLPYIIILTSAVTWILWHKPILAFLGFPTSKLIFPIFMFDSEQIPRIIIIFTATIMFFLDEAFHTLVSRAGNRNHTGYHVAACLPKGSIDFFKISYLSLNARIPDIIPVAVCASCLGSLCAKNVSEKIERWLQARMDVETNTPVPSPKTI